MIVNRWVYACLLALSLLCIVTAASAQFGGGMRGGREGMSRPDKMQRPMKEPQPTAARPRGAEHVFHQLSDLQTELTLTKEQQGLWHSYVDKVTALADDISREGDKRPQAAEQRVLQRLDHSVDLARNRLTALEDVAEAARRLYVRLTPEQQAIADPRLATLVQDIIVQASFANERRPR